MLLGIKRRESGGDVPPGFGPAAIRTILRVIDVLPFAYLVGFWGILFTSKNQRLGDMAANTLVVRK